MIRLGLATANGDWEGTGDAPDNFGDSGGDEPGVEGTNCDCGAEGVDSCTCSRRMKPKCRRLSGLPGPLLAGVSTCSVGDVHTGVGACTGTEPLIGDEPLTSGGFNAGTDVLTGVETCSGEVSCELPGVYTGGMYSGADEIWSSITFMGRLSESCSTTCVYVGEGKVYWRRNFLFLLVTRPEPSTLILYWSWPRCSITTPERSHLLGWGPF